MEPQDDQPDPHAAARDRREAKRRRGMQVTGRSTKTMLPDIIAQRGRAAEERLRSLQRPDPRPRTSDPGD